AAPADIVAAGASRSIKYLGELLAVEEASGDKVQHCLISGELPLLAALKKRQALKPE
ncbi:unnamed protein product, partial [Effrenium voratum]